MLWTIPGSPRKWSPWKWDRKTRDTCMKLRRLCMNCRCVPSPQSNRTTSGPRFTATALTFLFGVGHDPDVPRNTICMGRFPEGPRALNVFGVREKTFIDAAGCRGGPPCVRSTAGPSTSPTSWRSPADANRCGSPPPQRSASTRAAVPRHHQLLERDLHTAMPFRRSVGASEELAHLDYHGRVLVGEGEAEIDGRVLPGDKALAQAALEPLVLQSKEGLAIVNGTSVMAGVGALLVHDGLRLVKDAQIAASMSFEALRGSPKPFDDRLVCLKPQPGAREVAANLRRLLRGSEIIPSHKGPHKVQDPYTLRCLPQVLGAVRSALSDAAAALRIEMNAATDNPLIFPEGMSVSGGNFHAQALAMALDHVALGLAVLAGFTERRIARLVDTRLSDLPPFLTKKSRLNSGMMIVQYVAAGYASDNKVLAHPASADSIPTSANQEDFVPMGMAAALKARQALENAARVVSLEVLAAAQGLEFLKPLRPGLGPRTALAFVRSAVPPLDEDRSLAGDANRILEWLATGQFLEAAEKAAGRLA